MSTSQTSDYHLSRTPSALSNSQTSNPSGKRALKVHSPYSHAAISTAHSAVTEESYSSGASECESVTPCHPIGRRLSDDSVSGFPNSQPSHFPSVPSVQFPPHNDSISNTSTNPAPSYHHPLVYPPPPPHILHAPVPPPPPAQVGKSAGADGAYHTQLEGKCEFIQPPPVPLVDQPTPVFPCHRLFLGQVRFECIPAEVRWILEYLTGVSPLKIETRGQGCFLIYFRCFEDMCRVKSLHKKVLFDHTGIWYAGDKEQARHMQEYVSANLGKKVAGKGFRLPKDMMVVEEEKVQRQGPQPIVFPPGFTPAYSSFQVQGVFPHY